MSPFWEGFVEGYTRTSIKFLPIALALMIGYSFGVYFHPYEECGRQYEDPTDVMECAWILENE